MDPWHDYLALPIAPLFLFAQLAALFLPRWQLRLAVSVTATLVIWAMLAYVASLDTTGEGVNIGAGILALWLAVSIWLLVAAVIREAVTAAVRYVRSARREPRPS